MKTCIFVFVILTYLGNLVFAREVVSRFFPKDFKFGVATAAYQIEGAWNVSDKGESIIDYTIHHHPEFVDDLTNGDEACDSYHNYKRDVQMMVELGVDFYRFSISWPRLMSTGFTNSINKDGIEYYDNLINELISHNIEPVATLYHWDLPQGLQKIGGWTNPMVADYFEDYANLVYTLYGDRVKTWLTFNEPQVFCIQGYGSNANAPALNYPGIGEYLCGHTVLKAHAKAYHLYNDVFKQKQGGRVGMTLSANYRQSYSNREEDKKTTKNTLEFELGWFAHPIFKGDYPCAMKEIIAKKSMQQGFKRSRLPEFTQQEIELIKGTSDYFGINHYTTSFVKHLKGAGNNPSFVDDLELSLYIDPKLPVAASKWLTVVPQGFRSILNWIRINYQNPEIIVFECGYSDDGKINDVERIQYIREYLKSMLDAIDDGCNVTGFSVWSLMDNMEWFRGYRERFGLYYVHYDTPDKRREPKDSAKYYREVIKARRV